MNSTKKIGLGIVFLFFSNTYTHDTVAAMASSGPTPPSPRIYIADPLKQGTGIVIAGSLYICFIKALVVFEKFMRIVKAHETPGESKNKIVVK